MTDDVDLLKQLVADLVEEYPRRPTLLDEFAGRVLGGLVAGFFDHDSQARGYERTSFADYVARVAYDLAEAMLRERARRLSREDARE